MDNEFAVKTERLKQMLNAENLGGVLLNAQHNFAWLTGGKSNGINSSAENGACFLLVRSDGKKFVLANNIEMSRLLSEEIGAQDFEPIEFSWQAEKASGDFVIEKAIDLLGENKNLASDLFLNPRLKPSENLIARCRYELTEAEIERYRRLGTDASRAISRTIKQINAGETEIEIARKTKNELARFEINSVVTLIGADERIERFRHPVPTANVWKKILLIAVCAKRAGLIVNLSRIVSNGAIADELKRKTEAAAYVSAALLARTKPGTSGADLYQTASAAYRAQNFPGEINLHHQGGATGYKTRDWVIHPQSSETVFPNQAFAWNPSITGTKVEETALATMNRIEIVTESADFPAIVVAIGGREYRAPGILIL